MKWTLGNGFNLGFEVYIERYIPSQGGTNLVTEIIVPVSCSLQRRFCQNAW